MKQFESTGARDGGHHLFRCSSCNAPLVDVWVTYPDVDVQWNMVAECCHCGDRSYQKQIRGMFVIGPSAESEKYTAIDSYDHEQNPILIKTAQIKPWRVK